MIGAAGRVYLAGSTPDIVLARDEITRVLEEVEGRGRMSGSTTCAASGARRASACRRRRDRDALQRLREPHRTASRTRSPGTGYALRVHRPGYRTAHQIESELQWLDALREDGAVDTCVPVPRPAAGAW